MVKLVPGTSTWVFVENLKKQLAGTLSDKLLI